MGAAAAAVCAVAILLIEINEWKRPPTWVVVVAAVFVGASAAWGFISRAVEDRRAHRFGRLAEHAQNHLGLALVAIDRATDDVITYRDIGLNCWVVPYRWRVVPFRLRRSLERHLPPSVFELLCSARPPLKRVKRFRLTGKPDPSGVEWTYGKGAIGRSWQRREPVWLDAFERYSEYVGEFDHAGPTLTVAIDDYDTALPEKVRLGMTYDDFKRVAGRYGAVVVMPMLTEGGEWVGCVTLDVPWADTYLEIATKDVRLALEGAANSILEYVDRDQ
jgi:hypothetical protein